MDPSALEDVMTAALVWGLEVELGKEREETRVMREGLNADEAALTAAEKKRDVLLKQKREALAAKEGGESLVARFLEEADRTNNWDINDDHQEEAALINLKADIQAFLKNNDGAAAAAPAPDGNNAGQFLGADIDYLSELYAVIMASSINEGTDSDDDQE